MKKRGIGSVLALVVGLALMLSAAPASAICGMCTCENSCDDSCTTGPFVIDCPECNQSTCGASGPACGGCSSSQTCTHQIHGSSGGDTIFGGSNDECIFGHAGDDSLFGGAGNDFADGGTGTDFCDAETEVSCEL